MKLEKFLQKVDHVANHLKSDGVKKTFSENMKKIEIYQDESFTKWLQIYLAWNELSSDEDIENYWSLLDEQE